MLPDYNLDINGQVGRYEVWLNEWILMSPCERMHMSCNHAKKAPRTDNHLWEHKQRLCIERSEEVRVVVAWSSVYLAENLKPLQIC